MHAHQLRHLLDLVLQLLQHVEISAHLEVAAAFVVTSAVAEEVVVSATCHSAEAEVAAWLRLVQVTVEVPAGHLPDPLHPLASLEATVSIVRQSMVAHQHRLHRSLLHPDLEALSHKPLHPQLRLHHRSDRVAT